MMFRRRALPLTAAGLVAVTAVLVGCGEDAPPLDVATSPRLKVVATEMAYSPAKVAVEAGVVEVLLVNEGVVCHDLRIGQELFIVEAKAGESDAGVVELEAGTYELYCSLPGHKEAGMAGVLEVR